MSHVTCMRVLASNEMDSLTKLSFIQKLSVVWTNPSQQNLHNVELGQSCYLDPSFEEYQEVVSSFISLRQRDE